MTQYQTPSNDSGQALKLTRLSTVVNGARSEPAHHKRYDHLSCLTERNHLQVFPFQCRRFFSANRVGTSGVSAWDISTSWANIGGVGGSRLALGDSIGLTSVSGGSRVSSSFTSGDRWISFR